MSTTPPWSGKDMVASTAVGKTDEAYHGVDKQIKKARRLSDREETDRRLAWRDFMQGWVRNLGALFLLILAGLLVDGIFRATREVHPNIAAMQGGVSVVPAGETQATTASVNMGLGMSDILTTDAKGRAVVLFPDGSSIAVQPNSRFLIRLLDSTWGGKRDRTFHLLSGSAFARVGPYFGPRSHTLICTPNGIAASRGAGFMISYDPTANQTLVDVIQGTVAFRTSGGRVALSGTNRGTAAGNGTPIPSSIDYKSREVMKAIQARLQKLESPPNVFRKSEGLLLGLVDPVFRVVGLTPNGWNFFDSDGSRRGQTVAALKHLQQELTGESASPDTLNCATLAEMQQTDDKMRQDILRAFADNIIDSYQKTGVNSFTIRVRSRDGNSTPYQLTSGGVRELPPDNK